MTEHVAPEGEGWRLENTDPVVWVKPSGRAAESCPFCEAMQSPDLYRYEDDDVLVCTACGFGYQDKEPPSPLWRRIAAWLQDR